MEKVNNHMKLVTCIYDHPFQLAYDLSKHFELASHTNARLIKKQLDSIDRKNMS